LVLRAVTYNPGLLLLQVSGLISFKVIDSLLLRDDVAVIDFSIFLDLSCLVNSKNFRIQNHSSAGTTSIALLLIQSLHIYFFLLLLYQHI